MALSDAVSWENRDRGLGDGIRRATADCGIEPFSRRPQVFGVSGSDAYPKQERVEFAGLA